MSSFADGNSYANRSHVTPHAAHWLKTAQPKRVMKNGNRSNHESTTNSLG
jgi:hypothetical protein